MKKIRNKTNANRCNSETKNSRLWHWMQWSCVCLLLLHRSHTCCSIGFFFLLQQISTFFDETWNFFSPWIIIIRFCMGFRLENEKYCGNTHVIFAWRILSMPQGSFTVQIIMISFQQLQTATILVCIENVVIYCHHF